MTGRQRVMAVLNRQTPDYTPFDIGGLDTSSVHVSVYRKLRTLLGLPDKPIRVACLCQLVALLDDDVKDALQVDAGRCSLKPV